MSFQAAAQNILAPDEDAIADVVAASPRFPPRNHEDLVHAREYEDLLDTYGGSPQPSHRDSYGSGDLTVAAEEASAESGGGYSIDAAPGRKDLRAEFYGEDPYASLKELPQRVEPTYDESYAHDPYAYAYSDGAAGAFNDGSSSPWQSATSHVISQKKGYLNALTDMVDVARQTSQQLFEILPYCQNDAAASELVLGLLGNTGFIQTEFTDNRGNTLVNMAAQTRNETVARILLEEKNAKAQSVNNDGASPLHFTCSSGTTSIAISQLLLARRANPNLKDFNFGCTPLHYAASCADTELVKMLLKYGADPTVRDNDNFLPEDYAEQASLTEIQERLQAARLEFEKNGNPSSADAGSPANGGGAVGDEGWETHTDPNTGSQYQYNAATGETRWLDGEATGGGGPDVAVNAGDGTARDNADDEQEEADEPLMSVEEQLAAEDRLKRERLADALRQMEPARGLPPTAFEDAASSGVDSNVQLALEQVLKEHPQALPVDSPESAKVAAQEAKLAPLTDLLSATAAQHHVDLAERRKGNRSDDYKALEKEIELAVGAKKYGIADKLQQRLEQMEAAEETKIQTGADAKVVVTQGLLVAWVMAAFKAGAVGHATVARTKFSELSERLRRLEDDAEFIRDSAAKRIMEAEQKAKAVGTAAAADAATERAAREQELVAAHSRAQTLEDQLKQVRDEAEALRTQAAGAELAQKDLQSRTEEVAAKNQEHKEAMAKANADARALEDKCEALRLQLVAVREETAAATEAMQSSHAAKLHELQAALARAQEELVAERSDAKVGRDLAIELAAAKAAATSLENSLAASLAAAEAAKAQAREAQHQVEATKRAGKEAETQAARVQQQLELEKASLVARVDSLTQDVQSKAAALSSVSSSAGEREAALAVEVATLQGQVKEAREKLAEGGQWKLQLDQLQATMDKEQEDNLVAQQKAAAVLDAVELRVVELEALLEEEKAGRREDAATAAANASEAAAQAQAEQDKLRTELMGAQSKSSELDTVAEQLTSAKADIARLTADLAELREENTGLKRDLQSARSERDDARDMVAKQQEALHGSNAEAEADARRLETEIGALKSRLTSNDELHATEVASLKATNEKAAAAHAQAIKALQAQLTDVQRAAAEGEVAKLQATQLQTKVDALMNRTEEIVQERVVEAKRNMDQTILAAQKDAETRTALARMDCDEIVKKIKKKNADLIQRWQKEQALRRKYYNELEDMKGKIRVFARIRPLTKTERSNGCDTALTCEDEFSCTLVHRGRSKVFEFDRVFSPASSQAEVFADTKRLVQSAVDGYNVCIFAYGQTGSGKTFTMMGEGGEEGRLLGVGPRSINELFTIVSRDRKKFKFSLRVSMYELYRDAVIDLLWNPPAGTKQRDVSPPDLEVKTDADGRVVVEGGCIVDVPGPAELGACFSAGMKRRHTAKTRMNDASSRSHLVQMIFVQATNRANKITSLGKLTLVDLAGSERQDKTGAEGDVFEEAKAINKSLSALGNVINALTSGSPHVPYRDSKLTELMRDGIGGNAKTLMFVNLSPADYNAQEGNSSLGFAERCKKIRNKATAAVESKQLKKLKAELSRLKGGGSSGGGGGGTGDGGAGGKGSLPKIGGGKGKLKRPGR